MTRSYRFSLIGIVIGLLCGPVWGLQLGDAAPPLKIATWVKGGPVDLSAGKGKDVYLIEFWATWCGPCRSSIPHLSDLQKKYGKQGLTVVGISHESQSAVKSFVAGMGDKMEYTVAADNKSQTSRAYMGAFGVGGIPHAFLVDRSGALIWHGYPSDADAVLDKLLTVRNDATKEQIVERPDKAIAAYVALVRGWDNAKSDDERKRTAEKARQAGEAILRSAVHNPDALYSLSWEIMLLKDTQYRDLDLAGRAAQAAYDAGEHKPADRTHKAVHDYFRTVQSVKPKQAPDADTKGKLTKYAEGVLKADDPAVLNNFARTVLTAPDLNYRDLDLALQAAQAANRGSKGQDPAILNTHALALFKNDQRAQALELAKKALALAQDEQMAQRLRKSLELYQHADTSASIE